mmetsp:Transcript_25867/g.80994  ORF Transcript_25867/g.80994 Transcript_25867/m.80994 type:complete len:196 (-) Transcript_25867:452-1039(-)
MLAADKLLLQSSLKQNAIQLKEKEFNLHNANFSNIGTMASVLAGFAMTAFIEFQPNPGTNRHLKFIYYCLVIISLGANMFCVVTTAALSILGTGLALRGPDGSMVTAVEGMYAERARCFLSFGVGVLALQGSAMFGAWIIMEVETAACCTILLLMLGFSTFRAVRRIQIRLAFDESEAVDFNDVFSAVQHMTKGG